MIINGTLFAQVFNFFIAYLMLKHILFKPALNIILQHEERQLQVQHDIVLLKNTVAQELVHQKKQHFEWAHKIAHMKPDNIGNVFSVTPAPFIYAFITQEEQQKMVQRSVNHIVARFGAMGEKNI